MRSDDDAARTTQEFEEHRDPKHRGRRQSDQIFDGWTWNRVIKVATALSLVGGIVAAVVSFTAAAIVTRPQLDALSDTVSQINDKVDTLRASTDARFRLVETRQSQAESVRQLIGSMARAQCIQLQRWQSGTIAQAADLPCDSLLRRVR